MFTIGQRQPAFAVMLGSMRTPYVKAAVAAWVLATGAFATLGPVTAPAGWFILAALATTPPLILMHYCRRPARTLSENGASMQRIR